MPPKPSRALWTPSGVVDLAGQTRDLVELRPGLGEWFRQAADVFTHFQIGMHCAKCGADLIGKNADTDRVFSVVCRCREFVGQNREYRPPATNEAFYEAVEDYQPTKHTTKVAS